jgi:maleate isomerase
MIGGRQAEKFLHGESHEEGTSMYEWKYQFGVIVPSWNTVMEYECWRMAPEGMSIHSSRIPHTDDSEATLLHMVEKAPAAAEVLGHAKVSAICFGCTGGSFVRPGFDQEIIKAIVDATKIPTTTTSTAINEALKYLGVKHVAIASPYPEWLNDRLAKFLESSGFHIAAKRGLNVECPAFLPPDNAYRVAKEANCKEADVTLISCTNFRSLEVIEELEAELGKPVISSNTASMWKLLQLAGSKEKVKGAGQLFS